MQIGIKMRVAIADTMFARVDMGKIAISTIKEAVSETQSKIEIERYTVPGFKDLPVACKRLFTDYDCEIVVALAWVGKEKIDELCAHEANQGLIMVEIEANKHILKVFFHEQEALNDESKQKEISEDRVRKHTLNALDLLKGKEELTKYAGQGRRQGYGDAGMIEEEEK